MPIKLKRTNILYDIDTPEKGWVILGIDEDGNLVKKDENGVYERIVKDETYGIYVKLETDYLTIGNRVSDSIEGLYSYSQGEFNESTSFITSARGKYLKSTNNLSYSSGKGFGNSVNGVYYLYSSGVNSFVHSYVTSANDYGAYADYSVILGGINHTIGANANHSVILGGTNNTILPNISNSIIIGGSGITATLPNTLYTNNINSSDVTSIDINSTNLTSTNITSTVITTDTINILNSFTSTGTIYSDAFAITNHVLPDFIMANGTINTDRYVSLSGSTMTGLLVQTSSIVSATNLNDSNVVIGKFSFGSTVGSNLSGVTNNTILGTGNAKNLLTATTNVVLGYENAILDDLGANLVTMNSNIIIGHSNKVSNNSTNQIVIGNNITKGNGSNSVTLGGSSITNTYLYGTIYQNDASIHTSDERLKTPVREFTTDELNASKELLNEIGIYKFLESVTLKGEDARNHIGMTVQKAIQIMIKNNLDPYSYGFICRDLNTDVIVSDIYKDDNYKYGFRYLELVIFITKGLGEEFKSINDRLTKLEVK